MKNPKNRLVIAKKKFKEAIKDADTYIYLRDSLVKHMLNKRTPRWGGVKISLIDWSKL